MNDTHHDLGHTAGLEALEILRLMIGDDDVSDASRVSAAKALLDRFAPKDDAELKRREAEERDAAIAEARCLLAELAAVQFANAKCTGAGASPALAEDSAPRTDHATNDAAG